MVNRPGSVGVKSNIRFARSEEVIHDGNRGKCSNEPLNTYNMDVYLSIVRVE